MNYARIRNKLKENQKKLQLMSGADRTKLEEHIISEESKVESQLPLAEEAPVETPSKPQGQGNKNGPSNRR